MPNTIDEAQQKIVRSALAWRRWGWMGLLLCLGMLGMIIVVSTLCAIPLAYTNVPFWDEWTVLEKIEKISTGQFPMLGTFWEPNAGHRQLLLYLQFFANARLFRFQGFPMIALSLFSQIGITALYAKAICKLTASREKKTLCAVLLLPVLFSSFCLENILWKMQLAYVESYFAVLGGLYLLSLPGSTRVRRLCFICATACGIVASVNRAEGLLFWPAAMLVLSVNHSNWRALVGLMAMGAFSSVVFVYGNPWFGELTNSTTSALEPSQLFKLILLFFAFLGGPATHIDNRIAIMLGAIFVLLAVVPIVTALRRSFGAGSKSEPSGGLTGFLIGSIAYACMSLLLVEMGRYANTPIGQVWHGPGGFLVVSRYIMLASYAWISLLLLNAHIIRRGLGTVQFTLTVACVCLLFIATLPIQLRHTAWWVDFFHRNDAAATAMLVDVMDKEQLSRLSPSPEQILGLRPFLLANQLAMFAEPRARWTPRRSVVDVLQKGRAGACAVAVKKREWMGEPGLSPMRLTGSLYIDDNLPLSRDLVIINQRLVVIGLGRGFSPARLRRASPQQWLGYVKTVTPLDTLEFAVAHGTTLYLCETN